MPQLASALKTPATGTTASRNRMVLFIALVFWIADGYDTFVLLVTAKPSLLELLPASQQARLGTYIGYVVAITLAGWAVGGVLGGLVGDRLGRRRTMLIGVVVYSIATVLSATSGSWWMLALLRFATGLGIGAEWGVGTSLLQEAWPERLRTRGAGLLQSGFSVGGLIVSALWGLVGSELQLSWRWMYLFGIIPLIIMLVVYRRVPESDRWTARSRTTADEATRVATRRNFLVAILVSISITCGWWAVTSFTPTYLSGLVADPKQAAFYAGWGAALYNVGEIGGCIAFGFLAEAWGRKGTAIAYFTGSVVFVPLVFLAVHAPAPFMWLQLLLGWFTGGLYSWYAVHTPELFPTSIRASRISTVFSSARFIAMFGPVVSVVLATSLGGFGRATAVLSAVYLLGIVAMFFLPETRGKALPA